MNHLYRTVWNEITRSFVAVAENVKRRGKHGSGSCAAKTGIESTAPADRPGTRHTLVTSRPQLLALEPRLVFDGAAVDTALAAVTESSPPPPEVPSAEGPSNDPLIALPTRGDASVTENFRPGTEIDNNPTGETNPTYNDLLAIWDGYNGTGMDNLTNGTPSGWLANYYWSATPSSIGHTYLNLGNGFVSGNVDAASAVWVALQVRFPDTTAPTANFGSATDNVGTVTGTLSSGNTTDDTSLALAGTCESGSTVNVFNGAALLGAATVTGTGWSYSATVVDAPPTSSM